MPKENSCSRLTFFFFFAAKVPHLGPAPRGAEDPIKWKSLITLDGSPIECSWKWNLGSKGPEVRYIAEPISRFAGTDADPLNQVSTRELQHRLSTVVPGVDLDLFNHFISILYDHDNAKYAAEVAAGQHIHTTVHIGFEFLDKGLKTKSYFVPRKLGQTSLMPIPDYVKAIETVQPDNEALNAMNEFLTFSTEGQLLTPYSLAVDNEPLSETRIKWYFQTPHTSFASVRTIMTLGGRIAAPHMEENLKELRSLLNAVACVASDYPEDKEVMAEASHAAAQAAQFGELAKYLAGYVYHFDIAPNKPHPEIKVYIPTRHYGEDDAAIARNLVQWMKERGRGDYGDRYIRAIESLTPYRYSGEGKGTQTFISCLFKANGDLDITSYLAPQAYNAGRFTSRRGTRRRGDY